MTGVWPVAEVRAAEEALMARLPDGALMQRAAYGLAVHCGLLLGGGAGWLGAPRPTAALGGRGGMGAGPAGGGRPGSGRLGSGEPRKPGKPGRRYGARVALLVGAGNNGGDALYAGALLARQGARVAAVLLSPDRAHQGGLAALRAAGGWLVDAAAVGPPDADADAVVRTADLVLDGVVGIGGSGALRPAAARLAEVARESGAIRVAVDVPSGVDSDTGAVPGPAFGADVTVTFGCLKPGLLVGTGSVLAGQVELVDIGLLPYLPGPRLQVLSAAEVAAAVPVPGPDDDKYTRGVVGVVAGSARYTGAAVLATAAAAHGPAGLVRYVGGAAPLVRARLPEVVVAEGAPSQAGRVQAWVVGPGIGTDAGAEAILADVLGSGVPVLVDADGITLLAGRRDLLAGRRAPTVVTPHDREFARLVGTEPGADRLAAARRAAADLGVVLLLKGHATLVARPDGTAFVDCVGPDWLATAGSGDVLSGMIGGLLAAGVEPGLAAATGTVLHSMAGTLAARTGMPTASDVLAAVPGAFAALPKAAGLSTASPAVHNRPTGPLDARPRR